MNRRPTIVDVARHAGVSKSTVSNVIQNSPLVRPATRDVVMRSMDALNYVYNRSAANLRGADVELIGLIINDLRNPFFTEFAASAQMTFARHGYATVIANTDENPEMQGQVIASMIEHGVAGLLDLAHLCRRNGGTSSWLDAPASPRSRCCDKLILAARCSLLPRSTTRPEDGSPPNICSAWDFGASPSWAGSRTGRLRLSAWPDISPS